MYPWGLGKEQSQILSPNKPGLDARPCPWGLGKMPVSPAVCSLSWRAVYLSLGHRQLLRLCLESHTSLQEHKSSLVCSQSLTEPPCLSLITGDQHQLTGTGEAQMGTSVAFIYPGLPPPGPEQCRGTIGSGISSTYYCLLCFLSLKAGPAFVFVLREGVLLVVLWGFDGFVFCYSYCYAALNLILFCLRLPVARVGMF